MRVVLVSLFTAMIYSNVLFAQTKAPADVQGAALSEQQRMERRSHISAVRSTTVAISPAAAEKYYTPQAIAFRQQTIQSLQDKLNYLLSRNCCDDEVQTLRSLLTQWKIKEEVGR